MFLFELSETIKDSAANNVEMYIFSLVVQKFERNSIKLDEEFLQFFWEIDFFEAHQKRFNRF